MEVTCYSATFFAHHTDDAYILTTPHLGEDAQRKRNAACKMYEVILDH